MTDFLLNECRRQIRAHDGNFVRAVIFLAVAQVSRVRGRTVSASGLAQSLRLPYETTRRHVQELVSSGHCLRAGPTAFAASPEALAAGAHAPDGAATASDLRTLYQQLAGGEPGAAPFGLACSVLGEPAAIPAVAELTTDFVLRVMESRPKDYDPLTDALLFITLFQLNQASDLAEADPALGIAGFGLSEPRAASVGDVARRLGLPRETARRRMLRLLADGRCRRTDQGLIASLDHGLGQQLPDWERMTARRFAQLTQALSPSILDSRAAGERPGEIQAA